MQQISSIEMEQRQTHIILKYDSTIYTRLYNDATMLFDPYSQKLSFNFSACSFFDGVRLFSLWITAHSVRKRRNIMT